MAITIQQAPNDFSPANNEMIFTFTSTNTAQDNFSFYLELTINGALHSTHQVYREYQTAGRFDVSPYVRAILESSLITDGTLINPYTDATATFSIDVYEKYGATPTVQVGTLVTSATLNTFNGALRHDAFISFDPTAYNMSSTTGALFLTSFPRTERYMCGVDEALFLGLLRTSTATPHSVYFKLYDITGSLIASDSSALGSDLFIVLNCGPSEIVANTTITSTDFDTCYRYAVEIRYGFAGVALRSEIFYVYIDTECKRYDTKRLHWLNKYGVWDSFTFSLVSVETSEIQNSKYSIEKGQWSSTATYSYPLYKGEQRSYAKYVTDKLILNSDWIKEDVQNWLVREIYESPKVYLEQASGFEPIVVSNSSYMLKKKKKDGLIQEQLQADRTYTYTSQLN